MERVLHVIVHQKQSEAIKAELLALIDPTHIKDIDIEPYYKIKHRVSMTFVFSADWQNVTKLLSHLFYQWQSSYDAILGIKEAISIANTSKLKGLEWAILTSDLP